MSLNLGKFLSLKDLLAAPLEVSGTCRIHGLKSLTIADLSSGTSGGTHLAKRSDFS